MPFIGIERGDRLVKKGVFECFVGKVLMPDLFCFSQQGMDGFRIACCRREPDADDRPPIPVGADKEWSDRFMQVPGMEVLDHADDRPSSMIDAGSDDCTERILWAGKAHLARGGLVD